MTVPSNEKAAETLRYRLLPGVRVSQLGSRHYLFDEGAKSAPVVFVPTQRVREKVHRLIRRIQEANPAREAWSLDRIRDLFEDPTDRNSVDVLIRAGYLELEQPEGAEVSFNAGAGDGEGVSVAPPDGGSQGPVDYQEAVRRFEERDALHFFHQPSFFNLPADIDDGEVEVGLLGIPFASVPQSSGTVFGPRYLRAVTQQVGFWFDIYREGFFSELALENEFPEILCKNIMAKDYGDLGAEIRRVGDLMLAIRAFVEERVVGGGIRPIFVGGDHAISFPIVDALIRHYPDLVLIHFDAHNDLFYSESVAYNHGSTVSNLLAYSGVKEVYSFGLRTHFDRRVGNVSRLSNDPTLRDRVHLYSIGALKRLIADRGRFRDLYRSIGKGRPCYISIDLDVLSPLEIAHQVSTPCGPGLEWWELFEAVRLATQELDVVGGDIVEMNPPHRKGPEGLQMNPAVLLLLLIVGIARRRAPPAPLRANV